MRTKEKVIKKLLVGVDFSEPSKQALIEAVHLVSQQNGEILVVHLIENEMMEALTEHSRLSREEVISNVQTRLRSFCDEVSEKRADIKIEVRIGHAVKEFGNLCDKFDPDLVVLGAWGSHAHEDQTTGATAKQIVQEIKTDVLLMRPGSKDRFSSVVACIDFSSYDEPIIRAADQICLADNAELEILHVFFPPWKVDEFSEVHRARFGGDFEQEYTALLRGRLDKLVPQNIYGVAGFNTKTTVIESARHSEGILKYLKEVDADVAVIGSRGASRIESMILGRIAERIITESSTSVYVVKVLDDSEP